MDTDDDNPPSFKLYAGIAFVVCATLFMIYYFFQNAFKKNTKSTLQKKSSNVNSNV